MLMLHLGWFGIKKPIVLASSLALSGNKTDRLVSLCHAVCADVYLSGGGGSRDYLDEEKLRRVGVTVAWQEFTHPHYAQRHPGLGFVSHLAALDLLFNCGPDASRDILRAAMAPSLSSPASPALVETLPRWRREASDDLPVTRGLDDARAGLRRASR